MGLKGSTLLSSLPPSLPPASEFENKQTIGREGRCELTNGPTPLQTQPLIPGRPDAKGGGRASVASGGGDVAGLGDFQLSLAYSAESTTCSRRSPRGSPRPDAVQKATL